MRKLTTLLCALLVALSSYALAGETPPLPDHLMPIPEINAPPSVFLPADEVEVDKEEDDFIDKYWEFLKGEINRVGKMDLYGVTAQLPRGYFSMKWDWGTIKASRRYNDQRKLGKIIEDIEFGPTDDENWISIDMGVSGGGGGHTFQFSYGITDPLDWYIELPFTYMDIAFSPRMNTIDEEGNVIHSSIASALRIKDTKNFNGDQFNNFVLPALGRPTLATRFNGKWLLGDINTGFSWNIYRSKRMSVALTPRVFLPTGHTPNPNNNILYATGPEIETGIGGWAAGATQGYDFRIFKYKWWLDIIASTEFSFAYGFPQKRKYPNFPVPNDKLNIPGLEEYFPDLSGVEGEFTYTPGLSMDLIAQLQFHIAIFGFGVGYGVQYMQEPELKADRNFITMVKNMELLGAQTLNAIQLAASVSLLPIIPAEIAFQWRKVVDGYNAIVFDDFYQVTLKAVIPVYLLWESEEDARIRKENSKGDW